MDILSNAFVGRHFEPMSDGSFLRAYEDGLAARVFERLWQFYPGYDWKVIVNAHPQVGMVSVKLPPLMGQTFGFNFPIDKLSTDPAMLIVRRAGGEILEHWRLARGKANRTEYRETKQAWQIAARQFNKLGAVKASGTATPQLAANDNKPAGLLAA
jgi:hypothetical protein